MIKLSKIDILYNEYLAKNDSYIASRVAGDKIIGYENKINTLLKANGDVAALESAIYDDIIEHCPSYCDARTFAGLTLEYILTHYNAACDCIDTSNGEYNQYIALIALYENIKQNR